MHLRKHTLFFLVCAYLRLNHGITSCSIKMNTNCAMIIMTSMRHTRLLTCVKQYTGSDTAKYAQLNSNVEVNLIIDAISAIRFTCREFPHAGFDLPKFMLPPKQILSPKKPTRWPSNLYRLVFGGYLYISLRTLAPYNNVCDHTKSTGVMIQIISDTPKIMFLTCFTIRTQIIQFWIAVSYTRYAIVTITRKIVGSEALKSKAFAIRVNVVVGFSPFKKDKKSGKKHGVQCAWMYLKFYYTQVYIYLEKIINMKKNIWQKTFEENNPDFEEKNPSGPFPRHTT